MSAVELYASLAETLVWPAVVVGMVIAFRDKVKELLQAITNRIRSTKKAKVPGLEVEFDPELKAEEIAATVPPAVPVAGPAVFNDDARQQRTLAVTRMSVLNDLSMRSAKGAIASVAVNVETALRVAYGRVFPLESGLFVDPSVMVEKLGDRLSAQYGKDILGVIKFPIEMLDRDDFAMQPETARKYSNMGEFLIRQLDDISADQESAEV